MGPMISMLLWAIIAGAIFGGFLMAVVHILFPEYEPMVGVLVGLVIGYCLRPILQPLHDSILKGEL